MEGGLRLRFSELQQSHVVGWSIEAPKDCSSGSCGRVRRDEPGCLFSFSEAKNSPSYESSSARGCVCLPVLKFVSL